MTWAKYQPELFVRMAVDGLSVDAAMVHLSAIAWLYQQERDTCTLPLRLSSLGVTPFHDQPGTAVAELVKAGYWRRHPDYYEVVEHADVIRQSLTAQWSKREKDKRGQAAARSRRRGTSSVESSDDASATQANNRTTNHAVRYAVPEQQPIGSCRVCGHHEPLLTDGRCDSCTAWDIEEAS